jgi:hypothetical protein
MSPEQYDRKRKELGPDSDLANEIYKAREFEKYGTDPYNDPWIPILVFCGIIGIIWHYAKEWGIL